MLMVLPQKGAIRLLTNLVYPFLEPHFKQTLNPEFKQKSNPPWMINLSQHLGYCYSSSYSDYVYSLFNQYSSLISYNCSLFVVLMGFIMVSLQLPTHTYFSSTIWEKFSTASQIILSAVCCNLDGSILKDPMTVNFLSIVAEHALIVKFCNDSTSTGSFIMGTDVHSEHTSDLFQIIMIIYSFRIVLDNHYIFGRLCECHLREMYLKHSTFAYYYNFNNNKLIEVLQQYLPMLRTKQIDFQQKPRKRVKLDLIHNQQYDEFKGEAIQQEVGQVHNSHPQVQNFNINDEIIKNTKIFEDIKKNPKANKKINQKKSQKILTKQQNNPGLTKQVKIEQKIKIQQKNMKPQKKQKEKVQMSSNWKKFIESNKQQKKAKLSTEKNKVENKSKGKEVYEFVAIDCEFVKSNQTQCLARISLVNEHGDVLFDSYIKPNKKITDYVTQISGITYGHIKNAPSWEDAMPEIKRKMINKIIIGHTVNKDLEVSGLKGWTGFKAVIDVADSSPYSPGGKRLALKNLAYNELGKVIQEGWHSSVQDANATMQLFLKNKQKILKENKIIKS